MIYMVCYDICQPKRLRRAAKVLENYGIRVQKSFFQCETSPEVMERMKREVLKETDLAEDKLFIYPLCEKCSRKARADGQGSLLKLEVFQIL